VQFLDHAQRDPCAHRGANQDLPAVREMAEDGEALRKPVRDGAVGKGAARFAVTGIVVAQESPALPARPFRQLLGLGAQHVRLVAAEPDNAWLGTRSAPDSDAGSVDVEKNRCGHGSLLTQVF
jgi:hypothetical protein